MQKMCFSAGSAPVRNRPVMQPGHTAKTGSVSRHAALAGHKPAVFSLHCPGSAQTLFVGIVRCLFCFFSCPIIPFPRPKVQCRFCNLLCVWCIVKRLLPAGRPAAAQGFQRSLTAKPPCQLLPTGRFVNFYLPGTVSFYSPLRRKEHGQYTPHYLR